MRQGPQAQSPLLFSFSLQAHHSPLQASVTADLHHFPFVEIGGRVVQPCDQTMTLFYS